VVRRLAGQKNLENCREIVFGRTVSEIPPQPPFAKGSCEKIDLVLFYVIPAKAGIQCFQNFTNLLGPGFHRGDG